MKTLAQELKDEQRQLTRRMIYVTRTKRKLTLQEAIELSERIEKAADDQDS